MDKRTDQWWDNLTERERQAIRDELFLLEALPFFYEWYFKIKAGYYEMSRDWIMLALALVIVLVGAISYFGKISPLASGILIIIGFGVGVVAIWELERRR